MPLATRETVRRPGALFISWAKLRRADTIAGRLGIPSLTVKYFRRGTPVLLTLWKYFLQTVKTFAILVEERPRLVFVTNPPVFAIAPVYLYALLFRARYVIDFHSGCFLEAHWRRWIWLQRFFARRAFLSLVHNSDNAREVDAWGVRYQVFPSLPPDLSAAPREPPQEPTGLPRVVYICSFKSDEPVESLLAAARELPQVQFFITGRAPAGISERVPSNVRLTGFLGEEEYNQLLGSADLIVALTTRPGTLLYGAQEAIALAKPLVLSRTPTLESVFGGAGLFVENTREGIRDGIRDALSRKRELAAAMAQFARSYRADGEGRLEWLKALTACSGPG